MNLNKLSLLITSFLLAISLGYLVGRKMAMPNAPTTFTKDSRPLVPTIQLTGIRNGNLEGVIHGSPRFFVGKKQIFGTGSFSVNAGPLLSNRIEIIIPRSALFVASTRGKKYYNVYSAGGERIVPENRMYFRTEYEAEEAGYIR